MDNDTIIISMEEDNSSDYHSDYLKIFQNIKKIHKSNRYNGCFDKISILWSPAYMAAKAIYFRSVPNNIIAEVINSENTHELLTNIDDFLNYIFGINDQDESFKLQLSEYYTIVEDIADAFFS